MKKLLFLLSLLPFLSACDNIDVSDRYIEEGSVLVSRNVLLEEFTGQLCTNCPDAHRIIESLEEQYGDHLIVVSIHAMKGAFGIPAPYGLLQEEGDEYGRYWGTSALPAGMFNRTSGLVDYKEFSTVVREELKKTTPLELELQAQLSEDGKNIEVFTTLVTPTAMEGNLQLWVVESGIVAMQIDNGVQRPDYVHNNVFRACVNGLWGQPEPLESNVVKYVSNEMPLDEAWNVENLAIVGFYYNSTGVVQVEKCSVKR